MTQAVVLQFVDDLEYRDYNPGQVVDFPADLLAWLKGRKMVDDTPAVVAAAIAGGASPVTHTKGAAPSSNSSAVLGAYPTVAALNTDPTAIAALASGNPASAYVTGVGYFDAVGGAWVSRGVDVGSLQSNSLSSYINSDNSYSASGKSMTPTNDVYGNLINAHGAGVLFYNGTYYLYGESKIGTTTSGFIKTSGVSCYSSTNLIDWKYEGRVLLPVYTNSSSDISANSVIERPKVIYNKSTGMFVMLFHVDNQAYTFAKIGIATCSTPNGQFTYQGSYRPIPSIASYPHRDMTAFVDDDGSAYVVVDVADVSSSVRSLYAIQLNASYTGFSGVYANILPSASREAPALVKAAGTYYMINRGMTGWTPNPTNIYSAQSILGHWTLVGQFCRNDSGNNSYGGQSTFVLPVDPVKFGCQFIALFDIWNQNNLEASTYNWLPMFVDANGWYVDQTNSPKTVVQSKQLDLRVKNQMSPYANQTIEDSMKYLLSLIPSIALPTTGLVFNIDARDYADHASTWVPRVGSSYGNVTFSAPSVVKRENQSVHIGYAGEGRSSAAIFGGSGFSAYTIETRFKATQVPLNASGTSAVMTYVSMVNESSPWPGFAIAALNSTTVRITANDAQLTNFYVDVPLISDWMNVKVVRSATLCSIYVNKVLVKQSAVSNSTNITNAGTLQLGCYAVDSTRDSECVVSYVRVYSRDLTAAEIAANWVYDYANF